jgi:GT2 family glycosyltransferase
MNTRPRARHTPRSVAVLIVSHQRPDALLRCLDGLARQTRPPDDVVLVIRSDDSATRAALAARADDGLAWRIVLVDTPGVVAARNASLAACRSDVLAVCDDDTRAYPDWVERILAHFVRDPELGALGGRDRVHDGERFDERQRDIVGRVQWYGRTIGNHHLGHGAPREVHYLKGANMSFRAEAIAGLAFDVRLRGRKIQAHEDFAFSLAVRRAGWKVLYDPAVGLDHYAGRRDQTRRTYVAGKGLVDGQDYLDQCYNHALALWDELSPASQVAYGLWLPLIGTRANPGLLQTLRLTPREGLGIWRKFILCQRALFAVYATALTGHRPAPSPAAPGMGKREAH